jgi:hypothetical protein
MHICGPACMKRGPGRFWPPGAHTPRSRAQLGAGRWISSFGDRERPAFLLGVRRLGAGSVDATGDRRQGQSRVRTPWASQTDLRAASNFRPADGLTPEAGARVQRIMLPALLGSTEPFAGPSGTERGTDPRTVPEANSVLPRRRPLSRTGSGGSRRSLRMSEILRGDAIGRRTVGPKPDDGAVGRGSAASRIATTGTCRRQIADWTDQALNLVTRVSDTFLCVHCVQNVRGSGRNGRNGRTGCCRGCCHEPSTSRLARPGR